MHFTRQFLIWAAAAAFIVGPAGAASADSHDPLGGGRKGGAHAVGDTVVISANDTWLSPGSTSARVVGCADYDVTKSITDDFNQPVNKRWTNYSASGSFTFGIAEDISALPQTLRLFSPTGAWYHVTCDGDVRLVPESGPPVAIEALVLEAINTINLPSPTIQTAPPVDAPRITQMVDWLAIDPADWQTRNATATAGRVTVTVTTTPNRVEWDMGNGETVTCANSGRVWQTSMDDDEQSDCTHTYHWSSRNEPGGTYTMTTTVYYDTTITTNAPGTYLTGQLQRSTTHNIVVQELLVNNR